MSEVADAGFVARIIESVCRGCGICARACPRQAIEVVAATARVLSERCDGCEVCLEECPRGSITFVPRAPQSAAR